MTIIWRKNKNLLYFEGEKASDVMKELCKYICKQDEEISVAQKSNTQDVCDDLEGLRLGQLANAEAIQAISGSISNIVPVIPQFQEFMDKNKRVQDDELQSEPTNIVNGSFAYDNQANIEKSNYAKVDCPIVSNELTNYVENNGWENDLSLNVIPNKNISTYPTSTNSSISAEQTKTVGQKMSYANAVSSYPSTKNQEYMAAIPKMNKTPISSFHKSQHEDESSSDPDGFIGVKRKRSKTRKFFVTGIDENVKESQILSVLNQRNVFPTYISIFKSRRKGTISSKIHVPTVVSSLLQGDNFWPKHVRCKPWKSGENKRNATEQKINATHDGNYSTYV